MRAIRTILSGVDFSNPSISALKEARRISRQDNAKLVAIHILDEESLDNLRQHVDIDFEDVLSRAAVKVDEHLNDVLGEGHGVESKVVIGHPFEEMRSEAMRRDADLVVIGSQGSGDTHNRVGTLAGRCIRKLPQNVLVVRGRHGHPFRKIAACVDFSKAAYKACLYAVHLAQQDKAPLELFHMHHPVTSGLVDMGSVMNYNIPLDEQIPKKETAKIAAVLADSAKRLSEENGIECTTKIIPNINVKEAIEGTYGVSESDTDLLVVSTRGRSGLKSLLLGTVAEKIIQVSPCSVLVIKPEGFDLSDDQLSN